MTENSSVSGTRPHSLASTMRVEPGWSEGDAESRKRSNSSSTVDYSEKYETLDSTVIQDGQLSDKQGHQWAEKML